MRLFGEFTKTERRDDGTLIVSGIASSTARDSDGEVITADAMKAAILPFFQTGPAVREQHDPQRAVGTGISMEVDPEGRTHFECLVVDPVTIAKITSKPPVLRGFSIAGRVPKNGRDPSDPTIIRSLQLSEVSLVDRPAQAEAVVTMWKLEGGDGEDTEKAGRFPWRGEGAFTPAKPGPAVAVDVPRAPGEGTTVLPKHACLTCGGPLACPVCDAPATPKEVDSEKVSKLIGTMSGLSDRLEKVERERDGAIRKLAAVERERDGLRKSLDASNQELAKRPKGALRAVPVSKADDWRSGVEPEREPDTALSMIRKAHSSPVRMAGDGGPLLPRGK